MNTAYIDQIELLIKEYKSFLQVHPEESRVTITEFASWVINKERMNSEENPHNNAHDIMIGMGLIFLSNIARSRMNHFVGETPFSTFMDYQFLYTLKEHGKMTKAELISINYMEMSSGIEVIKRLIKNEWISESLNPDDKRSKLIEITKKASEFMNQFQSEAADLYSSFSATLNEELKPILSCLIQDLIRSC